MTTETATAGACGLLTREGAPVPLKGARVEATIRDYAARVVLLQRYRNDEALPIEAVYRFPLEEGVAVCGFEALIDGRRVVGEVDERGKAFERYDEALAAGHGACLLDEERADVFTLSVGALPPGKEVVLQLTTVSELPLEGDAIRFTLPTTLSPRYAPAEDRGGPGESEAQKVGAPWALAVPYGLELTVSVETTAPLRGIESPTHPIALALDGHRATVRLAERAASMDRDFVLKIALAETHRPRAVVERGPDGRAHALVSFRPEFESARGPAEVVFLVDRSGSMQGESIAEASPHEAPPVFAGGRVLVFGRIEELKPATVTLRGRTAQGEVVSSLDLRGDDVPEGRLLATLWARRAIRDLEEGSSALHARRGSRQERAPSVEERAKPEVVRLAKEYGLVSRETSYVAIEEREEAAEGEIVIRRVPVAVTRGWHGMGSVDDVAMMQACCLPVGPFDLESAHFLGADEMECMDSPVLRRALSSGRRDRRPRARRPLDRIVSLQHPDGSWGLTAALAGLVERTKKDLEAVVDAFLASRPSAGGSDLERCRRALATALALDWLARQAAGGEDEWGLLAGKARDWLEATPEGAAFWLELATRVAEP